MEQNNFRTKIGIGFVVTLILVLGGISVLGLLQVHPKVLFITIPLSLFITYSTCAITYIVKDNALWIRCPGLYNSSIPISSIRRISESRSILSSPAASLDRLEILYNKYDSMLVSPKNKSAFIAALTAVNPDIEVRFKK